MSLPTALVYVDLRGTTHFVGRLWTVTTKGRESATFEYDDAWLGNPERFALEPALALGPGPFYTRSGRTLFGALGDSAPDRWGRSLIARAERQRAAAEGRRPRTLWETDYLLGVSDITRQGALRFRRNEHEPFVAPEGPRSVPPLIELPALLIAAEHVDADEATEDDLRLLLAPGSSLGGARPKASVRDRDGHLSIAKFQSRADEMNVVRWEAVAQTLAYEADIAVAPWRLEDLGDHQALLVRRFDRVADERVPFLSAMSMLGAADREEHSYLEIADALRQHGAATASDLAALWRRVVFNVLISNTDDHLRNHGFLYVGTEGWRLAPAYDLNPVPTDIKPRFLTTAIGLDGDASASLDLAFGVAGDFGLSPSEARSVAGEVGHAVAGWREAALRLGLTAAECDRMATAFEHEDAELASGLNA